MRSVLIVVLVFAVMGAFPSHAQNPFWREPLQITNTPSVINNAEMAAGGGILHVVSHDNNVVGSELHVFYRHSLDGGLTFSEGIRLDPDSTEWGTIPLVDASELKVHVVYEQRYSGGIVQIAYRRSLDGGFHWEEPQILNLGAVWPRVACQGDSVYVMYNIWQEPRHSLFRYSYDGGQSWSAETPLYPECVYPDLKASSGLVFCAYQHSTNSIQEIYLRRSLDGGQFWQDPVQISQSPEIPSQWANLSVAPEGLLGLSWFDFENSPAWFTGYIYVRTSPNYGQSWDSIFVASTTYYSTSSDIAISGRTIHVTYTDERQGLDYCDIYYRQSPDGGTSWLPEEPISADSNAAQMPSMIALPAYVYIVWGQWRFLLNSPDLYFVAGELFPLERKWQNQETNVFEFGLSSIFPNPANGRITFSYTNSNLDPVLFKIVDVRGRLVRQWRLNPSTVGEHTCFWDGLNLNHLPASSGRYYMLLSSPKKRAVGSMIIVR